MSKDKKKYYTADPDKLQKKLESIGSGTYFKAKVGPNKVRILPPWSKEGIWYKEATLHYGLKNDKGQERGYPCLKMFGKDCPICDKRDELLEGDGEDKKLAERIRPRTKFYANILDRKTNAVMIWGFSQKTLGILLSYEGDKEHCDGKLTDPNEGFDVVIDRTGTGKNDTRYEIRVKPKATEIGEEGWEDQLHNLDTKVVEEIDEDVLEEVLTENFGSTGKKKDRDDYEDEEDEDEEPRKKHKKDEDDDEEDEDEDKDDDDEDEPKKKKKRHVEDDEDEETKKKKKHRKDDDEEEDDDEDDEDDE